MDDLTFYDREDRPWPNPRLDRASLIGHTTPTSFKLWFRVERPGTYCLYVSTSPIPTDQPPASPGNEESNPEYVHCEERRFEFHSDLTEVFDVDGLEPETTYYYALAEEDPPEYDTQWRIGYEKPLSATTFPEPADAGDFSFGLFSCHMPYEGRGVANAEMWKYFRQELADAGARFIVGAGDQVYTDGHEDVDIWAFLRRVKDQDPSRREMISWYRDIYRGYWGMRDLRRTFREYPTYMIWDDHEIKDGWGSYTDDELSNELDSMWDWENQGENLELAHRMFGAAQRVYDEYQHSHNPETPDGQWDYSFEYGPCGFYVLDMRGHRDYNREQHRILGADQLERVLQWIEGLDKSVAFIVSPVPMVHASNFVVNTFDLNLLGIHDDFRDEWEHESNWKERNKLLEPLFDWSESTGGRVVFLSGDVHVGAAFEIIDPDRTGASVHQLTSSGITYAGLGAVERKALQAAVEENGTLGGPEGKPAREYYHYDNLRLFTGNNFGIVRLRRDEHEGEWDVSFDLYGQSRDFDAVVRIDRLQI